MAKIKLTRRCSQLCGRCEISNVYKCIVIYNYAFSGMILYVICNSVFVTVRNLEPLLQLTFVWPCITSTMISATKKMQQNLFYWFHPVCVTGRQQTAESVHCSKKLFIQSKCSRRWAKLSLETCRASLKESIKQILLHLVGSWYHHSPADVNIFLLFLFSRSARWYPYVSRNM